MNCKFILSLLVAGAATFGAAAQSQGYVDGIDYYKAGQFTNAKTILTRTLNDANTDKALAYYYLGQIAVAQKDLAAAKPLFEQGLAANPESPYNYAGLGALALYNGDVKAAEDFFKQAQKKGKKNSEVTIDIARAYYKADPVAYAKQVAKFIEKAEKDSKFKEPAIFILRGDMLYDQKNYGEAAAMFEQAIAAEEGNPEGYVNYAQAYFNVNPDFAINKLRDFLAKNPNSALAQRELAEKLYEANYWDEAAKQYGAYMANPNHFPEDEARYSVLLYFGKDYAKSLQVAQDLLSKQPDNFMMQRLVMLDNLELGNAAAAVKAGETIFANPGNDNINANDYTAYAQALSKNGADSAAVVVLNQGVTRFADNGNLLSELCNTYTNLQQFGPAAEAFDKFVQLQAEPSVQDMFTASARFLNAAGTTLATDPAAGRAYAQKGADYVKKVIAAAKPSVGIYQRLATLERAASENMQAANQPVFEAYTKVVELLDEDPANMESAQGLSDYAGAYYWINNYYNGVGNDKAKAQEFADKFKVVNDKLQAVKAAQ